METKNDAMVLYPSPAIGHLISMVELSKLILTHYPSFSIHILIIPQPYTSAGSTTPSIRHVSSTIPQITFHQLPPPPSTTTTTTSAHHETLTFQLIHQINPILHQSLLSISHSHKILSLILDFFCYPALSVSSQLKIPTLFYFTSGALCLAFFFYLPTIHQSTNKSFQDMKNSHIDIPGLPPIRARDVPKPILNRHDKVYEFFLDMAVHLPKSDGIVVNTFDLLEQRYITAIRKGICLPGNPTPKLFCIGPIVAEGAKNDNDSRSTCLKWLALQPPRSVVFLCFGSLGLFSKEQLMEIAMGLEKSGSRFLWVVRNPPREGENKDNLAPTSDPDLDSLLPDGFLERTKDRGLVVKHWAPQMEVLSHDSVGGFVTHCGWNSVLEAVCSGVPMVAWPLYAEQRLNRVILVDLRIALPMEEGEEDWLVRAEEVEKRVNELMDSETGELVREQVMAIKDGAREAWTESGSSRVALAELVESCKQI